MSTLEHPEVALAAAAIAAYDDDLAVERARFFITAARGRPEVDDAVARTLELELLGHVCRVGVYRLAPERYRLEIAGRWSDVGVERLASDERRLLLGERTHRVLVAPDGPGYRVEVDGDTCHVGLDQAGIVRAPSPAVVVSILVTTGDRVEIGDRLAVLEAMKMEMSVNARFAGRVRDVFVAKHVQVGTAQALLAIEPETEPRAAVGEMLDLAALPQVVLEEEPRRLCRQAIDELAALLLGYDVGPGHLRWLMEAQRKLCRQLACDDEALCAGEERLLALFADVSALFEREPEPAELEDGSLWPAATFRSYLRDLDAESERLPRLFIGKLRRALAHYGVVRLERGPELEEALFRLYRSHHRIEEQVAPILAILERRLEAEPRLAARAGEGLRGLLDRLIAETRGRFPAVRDSARELRYRAFDHAPWSAERERVFTAIGTDCDRLDHDPEPAERAAIVGRIVDCPLPVRTLVSSRFETAGAEARAAMLEALVRRHYRIRELGELERSEHNGRSVVIVPYAHEGRQIRLFATQARYGELGPALATLVPHIAAVPSGDDVAIDVFLWRPAALDDPETTAREIAERLAAAGFGRPIRRIVVALSAAGAGPGRGDTQTFTFRPEGEVFSEEKLYRGLHPLVGKRLQLSRFASFSIERLWPSEEDVYLFRGVANANPRDVRLFALAEVRGATPVRDASGRVVELPQLERVYQAALAGIRRFQVRRGPRERLFWNRVLLYVWPVLELKSDELHELARRLLGEAEGLGLEKVVIHAQLFDGREVKESVLHLQSPEGGEPVVRLFPPGGPNVEPLDAYEQRVVRLRQRGLLDPYELLAMLAPARQGAASRFPPGEFEEYDLDADNRLARFERAPGGNRANIVVGVVRNFTAKVPEGMTRVVLLGDPGNAMGSLAEPECRRILAGLDLAEQLGVPLEWFAVSAGAKIAMDSGTENMDWIAAVLRRLIEFTQAGGEVNVVVLGINVGAQPYWNAEATMLMHTRGILIMTAEGAMVLTGKQALDYSGGVSAEDNLGIGGYEHVMGPNGQAQYFAKDVGEACEILLRHYEHTYVVPGERFPRRAATSDPLDRDVCSFPHGRRDGTSFATVGEVFSAAKNPGRKKPFDIRRVMAAVADQDHAPLERWERMRDAEIGVVWDAHLGGWPVLLLGIESRPLPRLGMIPADGPDHWTAGTLFPTSSKKIARALNSASGNRPAVILANLSGFDGSPDSMRSLQLEYGAEIGRAVVNFRGPIVFCVVSRYHGGAFVVFSAALNKNLEIAALEGTYASVIGGAPAAAVVFAREVEKRAHADLRVETLERQLAAAEGAEKVRLQTQLREVYKTVHSEKLGEVAEEFDGVHSIYRAQKVGSVHHILPPERLRPYLVEAIERGMKKVAGA